MSETEGRRARQAAAATAEAAPNRQARNYVLAAQGENVVLVESNSGRGWALGSDAGHPVWQPIAFKGPADRAPRGSAKEDEE